MQPTVPRRLPPLPGPVARALRAELGARVTRAIDLEAHERAGVAAAAIEFRAQAARARAPMPRQAAAERAPVSARQHGRDADGMTAPDEPWARTADRRIWAACRAGRRISVSRTTGGTWVPLIDLPGGDELAGPPCRTRLAAQAWAERHAAGTLAGGTR